MGKFIFVFWFLAYFITATPVIHFEDNPEFITTAYTLGVAHPPGYPLISTIGNFAGLFPIGGFAFRLNALAALFCAGTVYFFYRCARIICKRRDVSFAASMLFALSGSLWGQASVFEVYPLHYLFIFAILFIALSGRLKDFRWLLSASFLFGLAVSNHLSFSLLLVPFSILWLGQKENWLYKMGVFHWFVLIGAGILSWGYQLYIPARSFAGNPETFFSWGTVRTPWAFFNYITGGIYSDMPFNREAFTERLSHFYAYISDAMPLFVLVFAVVIAGAGAKMMTRENGWRVAAFASGTALLLLYAFIQTAAMEILLLPVWGFLLLLASYAAASKNLSGHLPPVASALTVLIALPVSWHQYVSYDFHNDYLAYDYISDIQDTLPEKGKLTLVPGIESNYLVQYGTYGPAKYGNAGDGKLGGQEFFVYLLPDKRSPFPYGLFNSSSVTRDTGEDVWDHIRSYELHAPEATMVEVNRTRALYRNIFKLKVASRVTLKRGYHLLETGDVKEAKNLFKAAAKLDLSVLVEEASVWRIWKEYGRAIVLLESASEAVGDPRISRILAATVLEEKAHIGK